MAVNWWNGEGLLWNKAQTTPYGAMNPDQVALSQQLSPNYQSMVSKGPTGFEYGGQLNPTITPEISKVVGTSQANYQPTNDAYNNLIGLSDPNKVNQWYDQYVQNPSISSFAQNEAPLLRESSAGFGTQGDAKVGQSLNTLNNNLATGRLAALQQGQQTAIQAAAGQQANTNNAMSIAQVPYAIQQAGMQAAYTDFLNSNQEYQQSLTNMNQFLGLSTGTYTPAGFTPLGNLAIQGAKIGAQAAAGGG